MTPQLPLHDGEMAARRLARELGALSRVPADGCSAGPTEENPLTWRATVTAPEESVYHGGVFSLMLDFSAGYPLQPPRASFQTRIYHPNIVGRTLCLDLLRDAWDPSVTVTRILQGIRQLLAHPDPDHPLDPAIAHVFVHHPEQFTATARDWVNKYAG